MEVESEEVVNEKITELGNRHDLVKKSRIPLEERQEKLPGLIYEKELFIYDVTVRLGEVKKSIDLIESETMRSITQEKTSEGKKRYTNQEMRKAELRRRLKGNESYKSLKDREASLHDRLEKAKVEHHFLLNMFSSAKWLTKLFTESGTGRDDQ